MLPEGTIFEALTVTAHEKLDDTHAIEHLLAYDLSLLDAQANPLNMPLDAPVELLFEVPDGLDKVQLEVVLVQKFEDAEFAEELVESSGSHWVKVKIYHFSPYALIDKISPKEKAARNVPTGDHAAQMTVSASAGTGSRPRRHAKVDYKQKEIRRLKLKAPTQLCGGLLLVSRRSWRDMVCVGFAPLGVMLRLITDRKTFEK